MEEAPAAGIVLATKRSRPHGERQQAEMTFASLKKREFWVAQTPAETLTELVCRSPAKIATYTYGFFITRVLGRPQGKIEDL